MHPKEKGWRQTLFLAAILAISGTNYSFASNHVVLDSLAGTWHLRSIGQSGMRPNELLIWNQPITAVFDSTDQVSGYGGCNWYRAHYEISSDSISLGVISQTKRGGPTPVLKQENLFFVALRRAEFISLRVDSLELRFDEDGVLVFQRSR